MPHLEIWLDLIKATKTQKKLKQIPVNHGEAQTCPEKPTRPRKTNRTLGI